MNFFARRIVCIHAHQTHHGTSSCTFMRQCQGMSYVKTIVATFRAFYITCLDFGVDFLHRAAAWIPLAVLRTNIVKLVEGGFSPCAKVLLQRLLLKPGNVRTEGVLVTRITGDNPEVLFLDVGKRPVRRVWLEIILVHQRRFWHQLLFLLCQHCCL